jgi:hypothetical protein
MKAKDREITRSLDIRATPSACSRGGVDSATAASLTNDRSDTVRAQLRHGKTQEMEETRATKAETVLEAPAAGCMCGAWAS